MIFSSASWLLFNSASTVERRARDASRSRSRSTSRATAEAASPIAVTALCNVSRSRSSMGRIIRPGPLLVPALVLVFEPEILLVLGGGAPLLPEDPGSTALLRIEVLPGTAFVAALVLCVPQAPRPPHLEVLPGDAHTDEVSVGTVLAELLVDGLGRLAGGLLVLEPPQRQQLALVTDSPCGPYTRMQYHPPTSNLSRTAIFGS